jgi:hypothetical protein
VKKLLDSTIALAVISGLLFSLGRAYQGGFLSVYGLEPAQFGRSGPEVLVVGFSVVLGELLSLVNRLILNWPWMLAALAIVVATRYAHKRWRPLQKFLSMMIFRVRRYRWTILVLSAVAVYVEVLGRGNDSGAMQ